LRPLRLESELFSLLYLPCPESISCTDESLSNVLGVLCGVNHHIMFLQGLIAGLASVPLLLFGCFGDERRWLSPAYSESPN
jgi:hypothetical protein